MWAERAARRRRAGRPLLLELVLDGAFFPGRLLHHRPRQRLLDARAVPMPTLTTPRQSRASRTFPRQSCCCSFSFLFFDYNLLLLLLPLPAQKRRDDEPLATLLQFDVSKNLSPSERYIAHLRPKQRLCPISLKLDLLVALAVPTPTLSSETKPRLGPSSRGGEFSKLVSVASTSHPEELRQVRSCHREPCFGGNPHGDCHREADRASSYSI